MSDSVPFFRSCAIEMVLNPSRVRIIPVYKCKIGVTGCEHISFILPDESRILPYDTEQDRVKIASHTNLAYIFASEISK